MTSLVEKNDEIKFDPESKDKESVTIKWKQNMTQRSEKYVIIPYTVIGKPASGSLFIQESYLDQFKKKSEKDESSNEPASGGSKIKVDDTFQYGQDQKKTVRFLVYHNKANKPYQHRFIETTAFSNIAKKIQAAGKAFGGEDWGGIINKGVDLLKAFRGDYLHNF